MNKLQFKGEWHELKGKLGKSKQEITEMINNS